MYHNLGRVFGKPTDYRVCNECDAINWYENDTCCECNKSMIGTELMQQHSSKIQDIRIDIDDGLLDYNTQIQVG